MQEAEDIAMGELSLHSRHYGMEPPQVRTGTGGLGCQLPGCVASVSAVAAATGGIRPGGLIETDRK